MNPRKILNQIKNRRKRRTRAKIYGAADKPRFSVFRSNRYLYAQLIDDSRGITLVSASTKELTTNNQQPTTKQKLSEQLGELVAKKAAEKGIKKVVFDKGRYKYHGLIKAIAEGARSGGLQL